MLEPDFNPEATAVQIGRCGYLCPLQGAAMRQKSRDDSA
jgi:hypothetical protein